MVQVVQSPIFLGEQFQDSLGNLLAGGSLYTYDNSFTNLQTTYANTTNAIVGGVTVLYGDSYNPNPITLNASGMLSSGLFLITGQTYGFKVYDAAGNLVPSYTAGNISV